MAITGAVGDGFFGSYIKMQNDCQSKLLIRRLSKVKRVISMMLAILLSVQTVISLSENTANQGQQITIREIGLTVTLPDNLEWTTRTEGKADGIAGILGKNIEQLKSYMRQNEFYLMSYDPNGSIRMNIAVLKAKYDVVNYSSLSDEELMAKMKDDTIFFGEPIDVWVIHGENLAFLCEISSSALTGRYIGICQCAYNGFFYQIVFRGTDQKEIRETVNLVIQSMILQPKDTEYIQIDTGNITLALPYGMEFESHNTAEEYGVVEEVFTFRVLKERGDSEILSLAVFDSFAIVGNESDSPRNINDDSIYQQSLLLNPSSVGVSKEEVYEVMIEGKKIMMFELDYDGEHWTYIKTIKNGYVLNMYYSGKIEDYNSSLAFGTVREFIADLLKAY